MSSLTLALLSAAHEDERGVIACRAQRGRRDGGDGCTLVRRFLGGVLVVVGVVLVVSG